MGYEVQVDGLTVPRTVSKLPQPDGSTLYQNGLGKVYLAGEVVPDDEMAEDWKEALESGEGGLYEALKDKLKSGSGEGSEDIARRLGLPFEGYDDASEEDILAAMHVLPSAAVMRIKEYEANRDDPRANIVDFNIGYGESPDDRQNAELDVPEQNEDKDVRKLTTREVPEDGPVVHGEGYTGTGEPEKPYGVEKDEAPESPPQDAPTATMAAAKKRSGRRERSGGQSGGGSESPSTGGASGAGPTT